MAVDTVVFIIALRYSTTILVIVVCIACALIIDLRNTRVTRIPRVTPITPAATPAAVPAIVCGWVSVLIVEMEYIEFVIPHGESRQAVRLRSVPHCLVIAPESPISISVRSSMHAHVSHVPYESGW